MPVDLTEKSRLFAQLLARLSEEHRTLVAAQKATHEGATHEEARPENDKDTRALEQSYLARGQAERVVALEADVRALEGFEPRCFEDDAPVALGALVVTEDEDERKHAYLLAPAGTGELLDSSIGQVKIVTRRSPLGRALLGAREADSVELESPQGKRTLLITSVT